MLDRYAAYIEDGAMEIRKMAEAIERDYGLDAKDRIRELRALEAELTLPDDIYKDAGELEYLARIRDTTVARAKEIYEDFFTLA